MDVDLFDIYQHRRIRQTSDQVKLNERANEFRHRRSTDEIDQLHARIDRLVMVTEAMWNLIASRAELWDEDLMAQISTLDHADGTKDGRRQAEAADCACGAKVNPRASICAFCGAAPPPRSIFDVI